MHDFCMGRQKKNSTIEVTEGVYLKKIGDAGTWHYYFTVDSQQFRKSTKTKDRAKASKIALDDYHDAIDKKRSGKTIEKVSFKKLAKKYLLSIKGQSKHAYHEEITNRHLIPFFGKYDDVSKINNGTINDYLIYRREKSPVKNQTLNRESGVLNQLLRFGADYGWAVKDVKIKHQSEAQSRARRKHFTLEEYRKLLKTSRKRAREYANSEISAKKRGILTNKHWQRNLLHDIIL